MARISILELPTQVVGEVVQTPFVLVFDQVETEKLSVYSGDTVADLAEITQAQADVWAAQAGAVSAIVTPATLTFD